MTEPAPMPTDPLQRLVEIAEAIELHYAEIFHLELERSELQWKLRATEAAHAE